MQNTMNIPFDDSRAIKWTIVIAGVEVIQASLECLANYRIYMKGHWLSWDTLRYTKDFFRSNPTVEKCLNTLFAYPAVLFLFGLRLLLACATLVWVMEGIWNLWIIICIVSITLLGILLGWRNRSSNNGSDQLTNIVFIAVSIYAIGCSDALIRLLSLLFIACQSGLSYLTSGFFKFVRRDWQNGNHLKEVLSTAVFGNARLKRSLDKRPGLYRTGSVMVIAGELGLGFSFLFPPWICIWLLVAGALFHLAVAVIMGLNTFIWAFTATYPAIYFVSYKYH
jgi:hypothetical protein